MELNLTQMIVDMAEEIENGNSGHTGDENCFACEVKAQISAEPGLERLARLAVARWVGIRGQKEDGGKLLQNLFAVMFLLGREFGQDEALDEVRQMLNDRMSATSGPAESVHYEEDFSFAMGE